jgi:hypothetical protein
MKTIATYEGVVENGYVILPPEARLPDETRVFVIVPDTAMQHRLQILSPQLVDQSQAMDFVKEVTEETPDANI